LIAIIDDDELVREAIKEARSRRAPKPTIAELGEW